MIIKISKDDLTKMGYKSLVGRVVDEHLQHPDQNHHIQILFEETSNQWKIDHNGADNIIIPEFTPAALCSDVLYLVNQGWTVEIVTYTPSPIKG